MFVDCKCPLNLRGGLVVIRLVSLRSWIRSLAVTDQSLKTGSSGFHVGAQDYGNSTRHCQDNGLVNYWLKIVQETWICELPPLNN